MSVGDAMLAILAWTAVFAGAAAALLQLRTWWWARGQGLDVSATDVLALRLRGTPPRAVLEPMARAREAGLEVDLYAFESRLLAGEDLDRWISEQVHPAEPSTPDDSASVALPPSPPRAPSNGASTLRASN